MKRILLGGILALLLPALGCVGYHNGYHPSYSPGCYSCSSTRHDHEGHGSRRRDHDRGHGGRHHHDHDGDHDGDHHHRHH